MHHITPRPRRFPGGRPHHTFGICVAVAALTALDLSKINVALPSIEHSLAADHGQLQLLIAGYSLAFGLSLVPAGRFGDLGSRRLLLVLGISAFTLASLACALAPDIHLLLVARTLQGLAAGVQMPQVLGLVQLTFPPERRGRAFGLLGALTGVSTAFGPTLGGLLIALGTASEGWRLIFWMNVPVGLVLIVVALLYLPPDGDPPHRARDMDSVGLILIGGTTVSVMLPFLVAPQDSSQDVWRWLWLLAVPVLLVLTWRWELHYQRSGRSPVLHLGYFRSRPYRNGILISSAYFAAMPSLFLLTTLYLQQGLGMDALHAGMVSIASALVSAVTAWIGGRLVKRLGQGIVLIGLLLTLIGYALVLLASACAPVAGSPWWISAAMAIAGAGGGCVIAPNQALSLAEIPRSRAGIGGSMLQLCQRIGTAIGIAITTAAFYGPLASQQLLDDHIGSYRAAYAGGLCVLLGLVALATAFAVLDLVVRNTRSPSDPDPFG